MPSIRIARLSHSFSREPLFEQLELRLDAGFTGLVGPNGAGKSTLLAIVAGVIEPDEGDVTIEPRGARVVLCPQDASVRAREIDELAAREDGEARRLRDDLALSVVALARWETLSPGERKRWQLGGALAIAPDVLLLDEPTNHLDAPGRDRLERALARFEGVGLVVTHDRALLERITRATVELARGRARSLPLPYDEARAQWDLDARALRLEKARLVARERDAHARLADARRDRARAEASKSSRARMKSARDHDARGALAKGLAAAAEKKLGRVVEVARRDAGDAARARQELFVERDRKLDVFVDWTPCPRAFVAILEDSYLDLVPSRRLVEPRVQVARDDRLRVRGANGAGKSTLLRALVRSLRVPRERALVVEQDPTEDDARATTEAIRELRPDTRGRVLAIAAALGLEPARALASPRPSPGEAKKLAIALGLARHAWAVVLDEPTNHLDLPSIEALERALASYPGALVFVTHDERFAERLARRVLTLVPDGAQHRVEP